MHNQDESGRSMVEMLGVLSIMGVIMYGAVAGINFGIDMYKINATYNEVEELAQSIVDLYSWSKTYKALSNKIICENDIYPLPCGGSYTLTNEWGGNVCVGPITEGTEFQITYTYVPYIACERLKTQEFRNVIIQNALECQDGGSNTITFCSTGTPKNDCTTPSGPCTTASVF